MKVFVVVNEGCASISVFAHFLPPTSTPNLFLFLQVDRDFVHGLTLFADTYAVKPLYGKMEVDFLSENSRLVIELDGEQHFADADAYRRDRRKDLALQQHGYLILRFLCEDLSKRLDDVLDAILRAMAQQARNRQSQDSLLMC